MIVEKTKRASILVEDKKGEQYSNGKQYLKFYIPISMLNEEINI